MEANTGTGLWSQAAMINEYGIKLSDFDELLKRIDESYKHQVNTVREYSANLLCKDKRLRGVIVRETKEEPEEWGPRYQWFIEKKEGIVPASYDDIINFLEKKIRL